MCNFAHRMFNTVHHGGSRRTSRLSFSRTGLRTRCVERGPFKAADFGLSDDRFVPAFVEQASYGYDAEQRSDQATAMDRASCPTVVLKPQKPDRNKLLQCSPRRGFSTGFRATPAGRRVWRRDMPTRPRANSAVMSLRRTACTATMGGRG